LPEALRLASNLHVAQTDAGQWSVSARGFTSSTGNKLLVLIDGRSVYSPLFAGMFWDIQDVNLEDVERIEVISGPGGTMWGANAVNGVINIITKSAKETRGFFAEGVAGTELRGLATMRYGAQIANNVNFRVYGKYSTRDESVFEDGQDANNDWNQGQGGFRLGWEPTEKDLVSVMGDYYQSEMNVTGPGNRVTETKGGNLLTRWTHTISENSDIKVQVYYDRVHRRSTNSYNDILNTYDFDYQHRFPWGKRNDIIWGAGYRMVQDDFESTAIPFLPQERSLPTYSVFIQDEVAIVPDKVHITIGTKALHNYYTEFEFQPSARLSWKIPRYQQFVWAAISRAVRTPSRIDRDLVLPGQIEGSDFQSETLIAYELGYRTAPYSGLSFSAAAYFNDYDKIRSVESVNPPTRFPAIISNGQQAEGYGIELTADWQVLEHWRLRVGYTELRTNVWRKPGSTDTSGGSAEADDPKRIVTLRSAFDISERIHFYPSFRYVSQIEAPMNVPAYIELDARLAWDVSTKFELSIAGQNLLHDHHPEFGVAGNRNEVQRNIYAKIVCRL
jgi:iron complex outermembrane receptor protein